MEEMLSKIDFENVDLAGVGPLVASLVAALAVKNKFLRLVALAGVGITAYNLLTGKSDNK